MKNELTQPHLFAKYEALLPKVEALEPSVVSMMYKEVKSPFTFYPNVGIFFNEFALCYCASLNSTKVASGRQIK